MRDPHASERVEVNHGYIIEKNAMKVKSHRRLYLVESDMSLSKLFLILEKERERDIRHGLRLCDDGGVWGLEIGEMEGEGWDRRWRVRVRVEIGDGGLEGKGWERAWEMEADVWEKLGLKMFDPIVYIQSLKPHF